LLIPDSIVFSGAFFIAYLVMLVFCGVPLVFMELAFGQFASLGPITVWKAAPLFKGLGYSMVLISFLVSIYYNMVTAWALHFLFTSLTSRLPWESCNNFWNTGRKCFCGVGLEF
jgi:solute carrier family 6 amino acid transporter-like protein 5/7/9/14